MTYSIEAEQAVLGALLIDARVWGEVEGMVSEADFSTPAHRAIFAACADLLARDIPPDVVTIGERLEDAGGIAYVGTLARNTPTAASAVHYARIVREHAIRREGVAAGRWIAEQMAEGGDVRALLDQAQARILALGDTSAGEVVTMQDATRRFVEALERRVESGGGITGLATGYSDLDEITTGLHAGDLVIVAGRPSMGKTTLAMNICQHVALVDRLPVLVFSLEMPADQLTERMVSAIGRVPLQSLRTGRIQEHEWPMVTSAAHQVSQSPIYIDESSGLRIGEMRTRARRVSRRAGGLSLVVVDYLQLMAGAGETRNLEVAEISRGLKGLAKELACPVIALSQLNRSVEQRANKRPLMADLRDSGAVEQDADLIAFVYRDEIYHEDSPEKGTAEIIIGKQRNGPAGSIRMAFLGQINRFETLDPEWRPAAQPKQRSRRGRYSGDDVAEEAF